ncbi:hypothetical protein, partial [Geobacillus sp. AYS3]
LSYQRFATIVKMFCHGFRYLLWRIFRLLRRAAPEEINAKTRKTNAKRNESAKETNETPFNV